MPELLEFVEAAFDEVALLVLCFAVADAVVAIGFWWDVGRTILVLDELPDPISIVPLVGDDIGTRWS